MLRECEYHFTWNDEIIVFDDDSECPKEAEHEDFGPIHVLRTLEERS